MPLTNEQKAAMQEAVKNKLKEQKKSKPQSVEQEVQNSNKENLQETGKRVRFAEDANTGKVKSTVHEYELDTWKSGKKPETKQQKANMGAYKEWKRTNPKTK